MASHLSCVPDGSPLFEYLCDSMTICTEDEIGPYRCQLCTDKFFASEDDLKTHFWSHTTTTRGLAVVEGFTILLCGDNCEGNTKKHYHCPRCRETYLRKHVLVDHFRNCSHQFPSSKRRRRAGELKNDLDTQVVAKIQSNRLVICSFCAKILNCKSLARHVRDRHTDNTADVEKLNYAVCVDAKNGIYAVAKTYRGPQHPIHVYWKIGTDGSEEQQCFSGSCENSSNCVHVQSAKSSCQNCSQLYVDETKLDIMFETGVITKSQQLKFSEMKTKAGLNNMPFVVEIPGKDGCSIRYRWFSVFFDLQKRVEKVTPRDNNRTVVTVDSELNDIWCSCRMKACIHRWIVKCHLFDVSHKKTYYVQDTTFSRGNFALNCDSVSSKQPEDSSAALLPDQQSFQEYFFPLSWPTNNVTVELNAESNHSSNVVMQIPGPESPQVYNDIFTTLGNSEYNEYPIKCDNEEAELNCDTHTLQLFQNKTDGNNEIQSGTKIVTIKPASQLENQCSLQIPISVERYKFLISKPREIEDVKEKTLQYILQYKTVFDCQLDLSNPESKLDKKVVKLIPKEKKCHLCGCHLRHAALMFTDARLYMLHTSPRENVHTYFRQCPLCHFIYRYQEFTDGIYNFDDCILITVELALHLRKSVSKNTSIEEVVHNIENLLHTSLDCCAIQTAYDGFEAMMLHKYMPLCSMCGYTNPSESEHNHEGAVDHLGLAANVNYEHLQGIQARHVLNKIIEKNILLQSLSRPIRLSTFVKNKHTVADVQDQNAVMTELPSGSNSPTESTSGAFPTQPIISTNFCNFLDLSTEPLEEL